MTEKEVLKLALEAGFTYNDKICLYQASETQLKIFLAITHAKALAQPEQKPEQEPVAKYSDIVSDGDLDPRNKFDTAPPQRKPLSDEQRYFIVEMWRAGHWTAGDIIDAVEALHGITKGKLK